MKILCGTDFSPGSVEAANVAAALARRLGDTLSLAHVAPGLDASKAGRNAARAIKEKLEAEATRLRQTGVTVETEVLEGAASEELLDAARQLSTRLVVVSSHSRRLAERWLVGSVSEKVAQSAPVPTLVVKNAEALNAWLREGHTLKVFVGADFSGQSEAALRFVAGLRKVGPCEVVVSYVDWPDEESDRLGTTGPAVFNQNPPALQSLLETQLHERVERILGKGEARFQVQAHWGRVDARLVQLATEEQAGLFVVGTHQYQSINRLWHVSVSRSVLHRAPMNMLCVPADNAPAVADQPIPTFRRVLVATDLSPLGNEAIPFAYAALTHGGVVHLLHVVTGKEPSPASRKSHEHDELRQRSASLRRKALRELRALIPEDAERRGIATEVEVAESRQAAEAICQAAERNGVDMLCLSSHGRSGLVKLVSGSVTQAVMKLTRRPLLLIRSERK